MLDMVRIQSLPQSGGACRHPRNTVNTRKDRIRNWDIGVSLRVIDITDTRKPLLSWSGYVMQRKDEKTLIRLIMELQVGSTRNRWPKKTDLEQMGFDYAWGGWRLSLEGCNHLKQVLILAGQVVALGDTTQWAWQRSRKLATSSRP